MHFDRNPFTCSRERGSDLNDFKFGTFIGRRPSDTLANMAVKGLMFNICNDSIGPMM